MIPPLLAIVAPRAWADDPAPPTVHLSWVRAKGAEACVDRETLAKDVNARLGRDAFGGAPTRSIEGLVTREGNKWVAHLYVRDAAGALAGDREITSEAADCTALSGAVTLAIALMIDPEAAFAPPPVVSASASTPVASASASASVLTPPSASASTIPSVVAGPPALTPPPSVVVDARVGVTSGLVPKVAPIALLGFEGTAAIHPRVRALFVPATRTDDGSVGFGITAVDLGACARLASDETVSLSACASGTVGVIHAYVFGLSPVTPGDRAWVAAATGLDGTLRLVGPVRLVFGIEALWPFTRYRFLAEGRTEPLFRQPFVTILGSLGAGVAFP